VLAGNSSNTISTKINRAKTPNKIKICPVTVPRRTRRSCLVLIRKDHEDLKTQKELAKNSRLLTKSLRRRKTPKILKEMFLLIPFRPFSSRP